MQILFFCRTPPLLCTASLSTSGCTICQRRQSKSIEGVFWTTTQNVKVFNKWVYKRYSRIEMLALNISWIIEISGCWHCSNNCVDLLYRGEILSFLFSATIMLSFQTSIVMLSDFGWLVHYLCQHISRIQISNDNCLNKLNKVPLHRYAALYTVMGDLSKSHSEESIDRLT